MDRQDENRVERPYYTGTITRIYDLPEPVDPQRASDLIAADQLVSSCDGLYVAAVVDTRGIAEILHNLEDVSAILFHQGVRILEVRADRLLVWGTPISSLDCGVYEISSTGMRRIQSVTSISKIHRSHHGFVLLGQCPPNNDDIALTSHGAHEVDGVISAITTGDGRYLFLEKMDGEYYRYFVGKEGFEEWEKVDLGPSERPTALFRLHGQPVMLSRDIERHRFRSLEKKPLPHDWNKNWSGTVDYFSVSPDEASLALIVKPTAEKPNFRKIYLNGVCLYQGEFLTNGGCFVWSKSGLMCGVFVNELHDEGGSDLKVITPKTILRLPSDKMLREFLVDDTGRVAATIVDDGNFCIPTIYDRTHSAVPLAWNLHICADGVVGYNSIQTSRVLHTSDETEFAEHQV